MSKVSLLICSVLTIAITELIYFSQFSLAIEPEEMDGMVTWGGDESDDDPIFDTLPPAINAPGLGAIPSRIKFCWTKGSFDPVTEKAMCHDMYDEFSAINEDTNNGKTFSFKQPNDNTITGKWRFSLAK